MLWRWGCISYGMHLLFCLQEMLSRALERKKALIAFCVLFLVCMIVGMSMSGAESAYHLRLCKCFLQNVCYSDRNVFLIFLERTAGCWLLSAFILLAGIHIVCLALPPLIMAFRAYTFGGCLVLFFSVYRFTGALIVIALYLPVHLLVDAVLLWAALLSCDRARGFCFCRTDFMSILRDFVILAIILLLVCLLEMFLLLLFVRPVGNLM